MIEEYNTTQHNIVFVKFTLLTHVQFQRLEEAHIKVG